MALDHYTILLLSQLRTAGLIGPGKISSMLEFGEQNWFGDVPPAELRQLIETLWTDDAPRTRLLARLDQLLAFRDRPPMFDIAKLFYETLLGEIRYRAVDLHGSPIAEKYDLNLPLPFDEQFDFVTNIGTAEHVFNVRQVFESMHTHTKPLGFMLHVLPNQGCYDHGLFNFHPTFVFDLAEANRYELACLIYRHGQLMPPLPWFQVRTREDYVRLAIDGKLSNSSYLLAVLRQSANPGPFRTPMQAFYDNRLPPDLAAAWSRFRG